MSFDPTQQAWPGGPHPGAIAAYLRQQEWDALSPVDREERLARHRREKENEKRRYEEFVRAAQPGIIARAEAQKKFSRLVEALQAAGCPGLRERWQRNGYRKTRFLRREYPAYRQLEPSGWPVGRFSVNVKMPERSYTHAVHLAIWVLPSGECVGMHEPGGKVEELSETHRYAWDWPNIYANLAGIAKKHGVLLPE